MQFLIKLTKKNLFFVTLANLLFIDNYINLNILYLFHLNDMFTVNFFLQFHIKQRFATNLLATFRSTTIYQPNSAMHKSSTSNPTTVCCTPSLPIRQSVTIFLINFANEQ